MKVRVIRMRVRVRVRGRVMAIGADEGARG